MPGLPFGCRSRSAGNGLAGGRPISALTISMPKLHHPEPAGLIQRVLAIPHKRYERALVTFLARSEFGVHLAAAGWLNWTADLTICCSPLATADASAPMPFSVSSTTTPP